MNISDITTSEQQNQPPVSPQEVQRAIHYVISQAEAVHLPPLDVETIKQILLTKMMMGHTSGNALIPTSNNNHNTSSDNMSSISTHNNNTEEIALAAARRVSIDAASSSNVNNFGFEKLSPEEECQDCCEKIVDKLQIHKKATLRAIAAARNYDTAWANLVPTIKRFDLKLPLDDIHSMEGKMTITEHISRCVLAMRALAVWQASAVHLVESVSLWRSGLNRPFPFALDGHCNLLLRVATDAAAIKSSPIPHALIIGGSGVNLEQVVIPTFISHLPSLCEFALVSSSQDGLLESNAISPQTLFGFSGTAASGNSLPSSSSNNNNNDSFGFNDDTVSHQSSYVSVSGEDDLIRSLARRWERRVIGMHFASKQDATHWALEAAEDVVASFAGLPGRRGQPQENYLKRLRAAEYTISLEHNTHWQLMKELLTLLATEGKHIPLVNLPGIIQPRGGEDGIVVDCPQLLETLYRTLISAIENLNSLTSNGNSSGGGGGVEDDEEDEEDEYYLDENEEYDEGDDVHQQQLNLRRGSRRKSSVKERPASAKSTGSSKVSTNRTESSKVSSEKSGAGGGGYGGYGQGGIAL